MGAGCVRATRCCGSIQASRDAIHVVSVSSLRRARHTWKLGFGIKLSQSGRRLAMRIKARPRATLEARSALEQDAQHPPQRLGGSPEQLIADRECSEVL